MTMQDTLRDFAAEHEASVERELARVENWMRSEGATAAEIEAAKDKVRSVFSDSRAKMMAAMERDLAEASGTLSLH